MTRSTSTPTNAPVESRTFRDTETGVTITIPGGFTFTTPTADGTRMFARAPPVDGVVDNISLKVVPAELSEPAAIQTPAFVAKVTEALCGQGASNFTAGATTVCRQSAVSVSYEIGATPVYGVQLYIPHTAHVLILTVTAGTAERAQSHAAAIDMATA